MLDRGQLTTLALFDKPDPLEGPHFEETLYVTPSRLARTRQDRIRQEVVRACGAAGLTTGPIHAEVRVNDRGTWMLEVAARSIGGLCGRVLKHSSMSLEELILRWVSSHVQWLCARMMLWCHDDPVPRHLRRGRGLTDARSVPFITASRRR
jgi:hypothetical protein